MINLNVCNPSNNGQIERMFDKAMYSYALAMEVSNHNSSEYKVLMQEHETLIGCIALFVKESVPEIRSAVIDYYKNTEFLTEDC